MKRPVKYKVVLGSDEFGGGVTNFENEVERKLNNGYELYGPLSHSTVVRRKDISHGQHEYFHTVSLAQALVLYEDVDDELLEERKEREKEIIKETDTITGTESFLDPNFVKSIKQVGITTIDYEVGRWVIFKDTRGDEIGALVNPVDFDVFLDRLAVKTKCGANHTGKDKYCTHCHNLYSMREDNTWKKAEDYGNFLLGVFKGFAGLPISVKINGGLKGLKNMPEVTIDGLRDLLSTAKGNGHYYTLAGYR